MSTIFCVDEDRNIRELIVYVLGNNALRCRGFADVPSFFAALEEESPDLILMELVFTNDDGMAVLGRLKGNPETADIPVMMISEKAEEYDKIVALDAGADDYVAKPFSVLELQSRIRAVLRRSGIGRGRELWAGELLMDVAAHRVYAGEKEIFLTKREYQLLRYLMEHQGILLPREHLLRQVWGFDIQVATRTVDVHIRYLRHKLGDLGDCIETVRGVGYRIGGEG